MYLTNHLRPPRIYGMEILWTLPRRLGSGQTTQLSLHKLNYSPHSSHLVRPGPSSLIHWRLSCKSSKASRKLAYLKKTRYPGVTFEREQSADWELVCFCGNEGGGDALWSVQCRVSAKVSGEPLGKHTPLLHTFLSPKPMAGKDGCVEFKLAQGAGVHRLNCCKCTTWRTINVFF